MNKGVVIFLVTVLLVSIYSIWVSTQIQTSIIEPQPPIPIVFRDFVEVLGSDREILIEKAINYPQTKNYLGSGYEIYKVYKYRENPEVVIYDVFILTQMQRLPWVLGITLGVQVDLRSGSYAIQYYLTLANLTADQNEQVLGMVANYAEENFGTDYSFQGNALVADWQESKGGYSSFIAFPSVSFRVPSDWSELGSIHKVFVDLENNEVVKVHSIGSGSKPPDLLP